MLELIGDSARGTDFAFVRLAFDGDRIVEADASGLDRSLVGLTLLEAAAVGGETLPVDALANAIGPVFRAPRSTGRVAVAMSGGVDSAVALLKSLPNAIGVTLRLWLDPDGPDSERACCSPDAVLAARATCHSLGLPHVTLDLREEFRRAVVDPFVRGYERGKTPNPCIHCNGGFRFARLLAFAHRAGADKLATGHYARIVEHRGRLLLARGLDPGKDQSYMLARVDPAKLGRISFPLGLERRGLQAQEGSIVDEDGHELGKHDGYWRFTPGQRKGLGVAAQEPLYAIRSDATTNTVVVGRLEALARTTIEASGRLYLPVPRAQAKLRYRSDAVPARIHERDGGFRLELDRAAYGVAAGQAAVLYEDDVVVGAGLIQA